MRIKGIIAEDFVQYKKPSLFIITSFCTFKCEKECGIAGICQNSPLAKAEIKNISNSAIVAAYLQNDITKAIVFGGLEPLDQLDELISLISDFRAQTSDDIVIYTGYNKEEVQDKILLLKKFGNIICKFGRFVPGDMKHHDPLLDVDLASNNQYAEKIC